MAENEVKKEKPTINMNIWFVVFIVYLILSVLFMYNQNQTITKLEQNIINLEQDAQAASANTQNIINDLKDVIMRYDVLHQEQEKEEEKVPSTPAGSYTGTAITSGDSLVNLSMTLTLSENNVATLSMTNESGDSSFNGLYALTDTSISFTSDDNLTNYSFVILDDGNLKLLSDDVELILSK